MLAAAELLLLVVVGLLLVDLPLDVSVQAVASVVVLQQPVAAVVVRSFLAVVAVHVVLLPVFQVAVLVVGKFSWPSNALVAYVHVGAWCRCLLGSLQ